MLNFDYTEQVIYCQKCCYPSNHPLKINFNQQGICSGCIVHQEKDNYDWDQALRELKQLVNPYRTDNNYDCIVPVSGGKDSYYIVHLVKNVLKLNPLLVTYNRHYNTALGIRHLERLRTRMGCDIITHTLAPQKLKTLTQQTLALLGSIHWPYLAGSTVFPVQVAVKRNIPLIIWGAHQGIDQVGMFFHQDQVEMTRRYRREHDLLGSEAEDLVNKTPDLTENLLAPLFYPTDKELMRVGVRGIYLNNYFFWDSKRQHEAMIQHYGYQGHAVSRTFDSYHDTDCQYYNDVHDLIKYLKFGYAKVVDQACREIRLNRLSRDQAEKLIAYFQHQPVTRLPGLLRWLEISEQAFYTYIAPFRDKRIWQQDNVGNWQRKTPNKITYHLKEITDILAILDFQTTLDKETQALYHQPQLLMRGWASDVTQ